MKWLRHQWYRVQLAHELLRAHEYEEAHRIGAAEAIRRLEAAGYLGKVWHTSGSAEWRKAVEAKADRYPSG